MVLVFFYVWGQLGLAWVSVAVKERLDDRVLEYLRTRGYRGMGTMSQDLDVSIDRVKWTLRRLVAEGKVEALIYGSVRTLRAKNSA